MVTPHPARPVERSSTSRWVWPALILAGIVPGSVAGLAAPSFDDAVFPASRWAGGAVLVAGTLLAIGRQLGTLRPRRST